MSASNSKSDKPFNTKIFSSFSLQYAIYFVFLLLVIGITIKEPAFLSIENFRNILSMSATRIIIAMGVGGILITGGTDLSAGRQVGLAAVLSASLLQALDYPRRMYVDLPQLPLWLPIILAMVVCALIGLVNGLIVAKLKVPPFIATLGTMVAVYGLNSLYFDRPPYGAQPIGGLDKRFTNLGSGYIGLDGTYSLPYIVLIAVLVALFVWILHNKTTFGKNIYAIGGNPEAAKVSGVNVVRNLLIVYTLAGALYGLGGALEAARTGGATNNYGNGYELDAIAACVVGGVSTSGGIGTVPGMVVGVLIFSVINYGLTFINMSPYWQQIVKGAIIIAAVAIDIRKYLNKR
ncbi:galactose/methyl galactoside ABC transporter permease MglC [Gracilinema caldarium]|uniref:ABC-type transporter, integral membrane subunit n=1 Tax=Gracilinema caldarium (strain ATCC 51460 / DSM 7334 / H1) TaxID=744872 RepID=F8F3Q9_GRAC1|nr:galactose/methyl galactoside ABC transporter permease MglC [Gracilinema caldarium]AEJ20003.1 ABC-type transporter, integral membrane subunit [Gracilinema caldarium DSM 7334]